MSPKPVEEGAAALKGKLFDLVKSEVDFREWRAMERKTTQMWMKFWIRLMHKQGYSNVDIAKRLELSESTIRYHIKKGSEL